MGRDTSRFRRRTPGEKQQFGMEMARPAQRNPEVLPWYWNPERDGVVYPPQAFQDRLKEIDPDLRVVYSPVHERWILWVKDPKAGKTIKADWYRPGWRLLMIWEHANTKAYLPLSELVFHNLYLIDRNRYPNAKLYFDRIDADIQRQRNERKQKYDNDRGARNRELFDSMKISTAGRGNKFSLHHDGSLVPSPAEAAWRAETRKWRLPSAQLKSEEKDRETAFYGQ